MDIKEAVNKFITRFNLDISEVEVTRIINYEINFLKKYHKGKRIRDGRIIEMAYENMCNWYTAIYEEPFITNKWEELRHFVSFGRIAFIWITFLNKDDLGKRAAFLGLMR